MISYASRGLTKAEKNYPAHRMEFLALTWAITEKFREYLYGAQHFTVLTHNTPLTYVLSSAKLDATGHRWLAALAAYNFDIRYRPGINTVDADVLSRLPPTKHEPEYIAEDTVDPSPRNQSWITSVSSNVVDVSDALVDNEMSENDSRDWWKLQGQGPILAPWMSAVRRGIKPKWKDVPHISETAPLLKNFGSLEF